MKPCTNCQRVTNNDRLRRGRCMSCYRYLLRHGSDRPREAMIRSSKQHRPLCYHCQQTFAGTHSRTLCDACYQYQQQRGRPRPKYLWAEKCKVCGKPRRDDRRDGFTKGRCRICYNYLYRFGKDRDRDRIAARLPHGYCECGHPAIAVVRLRWGGPHHLSHGQADYPLCLDCLKEETVCQSRV